VGVGVVSGLGSEFYLWLRSLEESGSGSAFPAWFGP
jgi:hypothetical protein